MAEAGATAVAIIVLIATNPGGTGNVNLGGFT
jgi:hypothetical protein